MKFYLSLIALLFSLSPWLSAQEDKTPTPPTEVKSVRVAVLGYHEFSSSQTATEMCLPMTKFRKQLQEIKDNNLNVITLADFLAWKRGEKTIPDRSVLITIDDGWKSVYTHAYPLLKEFNYPFTIYLYKNYVDGGGRALTSAMIKEMQISKLCTIGSHSVSHPLPSTVKKYKKKGPEAFDLFLEKEIGESKKFLVAKFKQKITSYAYPGGYHTEEMYDKAEKHGYEVLFTVRPGKVKIESENHILTRYIILGTHDYIFKNAITFKNLASATPDIASLAIKTAHPVLPAPATAVETRTPVISANLKDVTNLDPDSIEMRVAGFGQVPFTYDAVKKSCSWKVNRPLHSASVEVKITWKLIGETKPEPPMKWTFLVDRTAEYQPRSLINDQPDTSVEGADK